MVVRGVYLREIRHSLTKTVVVVSYQIWWADTQNKTEQMLKYTTQESSGVGSCWQFLTAHTSLNPLFPFICNSTGEWTSNGPAKLGQANAKLGNHAQPHIYIHKPAYTYKHCSCLARIKLKHLLSMSLVDYLTKINYAVARTKST